MKKNMIHQVSCLVSVVDKQLLLESFGRNYTINLEV